MEKMEPLPLIRFDSSVTQACRINNDEQIADDGQMPKQGGNAEKLKTINGFQ
jgi:hypothetical protein